MLGSNHWNPQHIRVLCERVDSLQGRDFCREKWWDSNIFACNYMTKASQRHENVVKLKKAGSTGSYSIWGRKADPFQWLMNTAALRKRKGVHSTVGAWLCQNSKPWPQCYPCGLPLHSTINLSLKFSSPESYTPAIAGLFFLMSQWLEVSTDSFMLFWCLWLDIISEFLSLAWYLSSSEPVCDLALIPFDVQMNKWR